MLYKPDTIGSLASTLCLVHCLATPFIFITQACTISCCADTPIWWQSIDYIFIVISFFAILGATKTSTNKIISRLLWITWFIFFALILNKSLGLVYLDKNFGYSAGIILACLHIYNLRYCQCKSDNCCANNKNLKKTILN
ncbi:MAG: MerC domain-containing protein [Flavobacteriales bacterium TMED191]|nr:MAG: MerC domain-containing protein [Flavobacteriales bacterium TMED191]